MNRYRYFFLTLPLLLVMVGITSCDMPDVIKSKLSWIIGVDLTNEPYSEPIYDGIDVSCNNGDIDWKLVAENKNIKFVYIKATQGATVIDPKYSRNLREARENGLKCGSYHFLSSNTPIHSQFSNFCSVVDKQSQDLIPVVDVESPVLDEWSKEQLSDSLALFVDLIRNQYGISPIIYTNESFFNSNLAAKFNKDILFVARYGKQQPHLNDGKAYMIWQYSETGHISGIERAYVDLCRLYDGMTVKQILLPR